MKKLSLIILAVLLVFSMAACGNDKKDDSKDNSILNMLPTVKTVATPSIPAEACVVCGSNENIGYCMECPESLPICEDCFCPNCFETCADCGNVYEVGEYCDICYSCFYCGNKATMRNSACDDCADRCIFCDAAVYTGEPFTEEEPYRFCSTCERAYCKTHETYTENALHHYCKLCGNGWSIIDDDIISYTCTACDKLNYIKDDLCDNCLNAEGKERCYKCLGVIDACSDHTDTCTGD